jgi:hypothetical protein
MLGRAAILVLVMLSISAPAYAIDHKNLDAGRPTRLDDAYTIAAGEIEVGTGLGATVARRGSARGVFPMELLYGALPNLQLGLGTSFTSDPRSAEGPDKSGNLRLGALYKFNQATLTLPAFGVRLDVGLPTGINADGATVKIKGIVTRSIDRLGLHFNAGYEFVTEPRGNERSGQYELVLGGSYPVGAPRYTRATIIADVFTDQGVRRDEPNTGGAELGFRYQVTSRWIWDAGVGTEFAGPADRHRFFFTTGLSFGF